MTLIEERKNKVGNNILNQNELMHYGVKGMKWGVRKKYQSAARSLGGSRFTKKAIKDSRYLNAKGKKQALDEQAYLAAKKKQKKTGGQITYDVATGKYTVSKGNKKRHIGIDDKGNINLVDKPTSKNNIKKFAVKSGITMAGVSLSIYISKHPEIIVKGSEKVSKLINKNGSKKVTDIMDREIPKIYSKTLGRALTPQELIEKGFL